VHGVARRLAARRLEIEVGARLQGGDRRRVEQAGHDEIAMLPIVADLRFADHPTPPALSGL